MGPYMEIIGSYGRRFGTLIGLHYVRFTFSLSAHIEGLRKLPNSYTNQHYHTQTVYDLHGDDDKKRVARFRIVPADGSQETGRLDYEDQKNCWCEVINFWSLSTRAKLR